MGAGEIIRREREALGVSLRELARLAGVNHGDLSRVERGETAPSARLAAQVCRVLGLRLADVYAGLEDGAEPAAEDMVAQIRAILIRGRWPPLAREGLVNLARATRPAAYTDVDAHLNANTRILVGAR